MFKNSKEFSLFIERKALDNKLSYLDAILKYCEENYIDPEEVAGLVSKSLRDKLEIDFQEAHYLPKGATLEV